MKEINNKDTAVLLAALDNEISIKCMELKKEQKQIKLKKIFFFSCLIILSIFVMQVFFNIFNLNFIFMILIYQIAILIVVMPIITTLNEGES